MPTLLVFSLAPEGDCDRRPLLAGRLRRLELDLRRSCLERTLDAGRAAGLAIELAMPGRASTPHTWRHPVRRVSQTGATFGERVRSALDGAWSRNPGGPVVLVGTDTPALGARHLRRAVELVHADPDVVVLGPSRDGGFYLAAAARPFDGALARVRWCGAHTRRDLVAALESEGRPVVLLEPLADLDRPRDLLSLLRPRRPVLTAEHLARRILAALRDLARPLSAPAPARALTDLASVRELRGPPA